MSSKNALFAPDASKIWTIPATCAFTDVLAAQLLAEADQGLIVLEEVTVLLPNRRAVRALQEAFLRQSEARALLLPKLMTVGDLDAEEGEALEFAELPGAIAAALELPQAIHPMRRRLLLTRMIFAAKALFSDSIEQALIMADELARLLDQCQTEAIELDKLEELAKDSELAEHWEKTLRFLTLIREVWPEFLAVQELIDPAERRHKAMMVQAQAWAELTPPQPFILAGSTGSIKATRALMKTVLGLPLGRLILPGLDTHMPFAAWEDVARSPAHPQHGLALLLEDLTQNQPDFSPNQIPELNASSSNQLGPSARIAFSRLAMLPPETIADPELGWQAAQSSSPEALSDEATDGLSYLACSDQAQEAAVIALAMREVLETPEKTAALVTPDRNLARRVIAELTRYGILVEETAGTPLKNTSLGAFVRLTARLLAEDFAPVALLSVLKQAQAQLGMPKERLRQSTRAFELAVLRGPRPATPGIPGLLEAHAALPEKNALKHDARPLVAALTKLQDSLKGWREADLPLSQRIQIHLDLLEALSLGEDPLAPSPLWQGEAGETLQELFVSLQDHSGDLIDLNLAGSDYPDFFDTLMGETPIRKAYGAHPRLAIWGTMEARLQKADLMILGGLNEGSWPTPTDTGPWMSRPMRTQIGLPSPERKIGLAAHDFAQALGASEVFITRATKSGGAPTVPSRWILRMDSILPEGRKLKDLKPASPYVAWLEQLNQPIEIQRRPRPAPCPPVAARPRALSVTQVGKWMRDPYWLYAKKILLLDQLDELDADPTVADKGNILHDCLHAFIQEFGLTLPLHAQQRLLEMAQDEAEKQLQSPLVLRFWQQRQARIVPWFIDRQAERLPRLENIVTEEKALWRFETPGGQFELKAFADRVDLTKDGTLGIIDYKTGGAPSNPDILSGLDPQLPLEALIAQEAGWGKLPPRPVAALEHWQLTGGRPAGKISPVKDVEEAVASAREGLMAMIAAFDRAEQPYLAQPDASVAPRYNEFEHLERIAEWKGEET